MIVDIYFVCVILGGLSVLYLNNRDRKRGVDIDSCGFDVFLMLFYTFCPVWNFIVFLIAIYYIFPKLTEITVKILTKKIF